MYHSFFHSLILLLIQFNYSMLLVNSRKLWYFHWYSLLALTTFVQYARIRFNYLTLLNLLLSFAFLCLPIRFFSFSIVCSCFFLFLIFFLSSAICFYLLTIRLYLFSSCFYLVLPVYTGLPVVSHFRAYALRLAILVT